MTPMEWSILMLCDEATEVGTRWRMMEDLAYSNNNMVKSFRYKKQSFMYDIDRGNFSWLSFLDIFGFLPHRPSPRLFIREL